MKQQLLQFLSCPDCAGPIQLATTTLSEGEEIIEGEFTELADADAPSKHLDQRSGSEEAAQGSE